MLRASCNRCHRDKARCRFDGIDATACVRCHQRNGICIRDPSLPIGRTRGSKNKVVSHKANSGGSLQSVVVHGREQSRSVQCPQGAVSDGDTAMETRTTVGAIVPWDPMLSFPDYLDYLDGPLSGVVFDGDQSTSDSLLGMPSWASDPSPSQLMIGTATGPSPKPTLHSPHASSASEPPQSETRTPDNPSESGYGLATSCGCARSLVQLLGRHPLPSLLATMPTFDQVLSTNRSTMHVIGELLSCKVVHADSSFLMTACVLVQSILTSTHEVWWSDCKLVHQGLGASKQKVSIGGFMVSDEDSRILRQQMICLDLQKVKQLLDQIQDKLKEPKCTAAQERYPAGDIGHLVGTLLRTQLERLFNRTSQRPST